MEGAGVGVQRRPTASITHKRPARTTTYGKVAEAAAKLEVPKDVKLKDPKDWKIAGKPLKRLDTADKVIGKMIYGIDVKLPGMLNAAIKAMPGVRRQGEELRRRQGREDAGREEGRAGRRQRRRRGGRHLLARQDRARALPIEWDTVGNEKVSTAPRSPSSSKAGLDADQAFVGNENGDVKAAIAGAAKKVEAVYTYPYQNHARWSR